MDLIHWETALNTGVMLVCSIHSCGVKVEKGKGRHPKVRNLSEISSYIFTERQLFHRTQHGDLQWNINTCHYLWHQNLPKTTGILRLRNLQVYCFVLLQH